VYEVGWWLNFRTKINISIGDDMELTLKQFKGAIKEDKQIY